MRRILYSALFCALAIALDFPASGQMRGPMGDIFQGQPPPPGAVTVLGRSFLGSLENGFGNSLLLLMGSDNENIRQELGLTSAEANSIQLIRAQMLLGAPRYAERFRTMTEENQQSVQQDLTRDMGRIIEAFDNVLPPERKEKVQKLVFQSLGGLDSPLTTLNSMEALNLSEDQRQKLQSVFDEMKEERMEHMEKGLKIMERVIAAGGPQNLSEEEQEELRKMGQELETQSYATARKLAERLRQHLTPAQLELEKQLIASRPEFLGRLPRQMQREGSTGTGESEVYTPGINSWQPGMPLPVPVQERPPGRFPRASQAESSPERE